MVQGDIRRLPGERLGERICPLAVAVDLYEAREAAGRGDHELYAKPAEEVVRAFYGSLPL